MLQKVHVEQYFDAEKTEAILFMVVGALAILAALAVWLSLKSQWSIGLCIPLVALAAVQLAVGWAVYSSADRQRTDVVYAMDLDPAAIREKEIPRMQKVMRNFQIYRYTELACVILGAVLMWKCSFNGSLAFWNGIGCGLSAQALILLVLDFFAEKRGGQYLQSLLNWTQR